MKNLLLIVAMGFTFYSIGQTKESWPSCIDTNRLNPITYNIYKNHGMSYFKEDTIQYKEIELELTDSICLTEEEVKEEFPDHPFNAKRYYKSVCQFPILIGLNNDSLERKIDQILQKEWIRHKKILPKDQRFIFGPEKIWKKDKEPKSGTFIYQNIWSVMHLDTNFLILENRQMTNHFPYVYDTISSFWSHFGDDGYSNRKRPSYFMPDVNYLTIDVRTLKEIDLIKELTVRMGERKLRQHVRKRYDEKEKWVKKEFDLNVSFQLYPLRYGIDDNELVINIYVKERMFEYGEIDISIEHFGYGLLDRYEELLPFFKEKYRDLISDGWWSKQQNKSKLK